MNELILFNFLDATGLLSFVEACLEDVDIPEKKEEVMDIITDLLLEQYTLEEMEQIAEFYTSSAGQKFIDSIEPTHEQVAYIIAVKKAESDKEQAEPIDPYSIN